MKTIRVLLAAAMAMLMVSGCVSDTARTRSEKLALYRANAKPPVDSFLYFGHLNSWTPLGDEALAIWTSPSEAYLLEIGGPCPDLDIAQAISLSQQSGRVHARFDKVTPQVPGSGPRSMPCYIREIRPLDVKALKAAEREKRQQDDG